MLGFTAVVVSVVLALAACGDDGTATPFPSPGTTPTATPPETPLPSTPTPSGDSTPMTTPTPDATGIPGGTQTPTGEGTPTPMTTATPDDTGTPTVPPSGTTPSPTTGASAEATGTVIQVDTSAQQIMIAPDAATNLSLAVTDDTEITVNGTADASLEDVRFGMTLRVTYEPETDVAMSIEQVAGGGAA